MARSVACLPGDGIGPEVMAQAVRVLAALGFETTEHLFGGAAIDATGESAARPRRSPRRARPTPSCSARSAARSGTDGEVRPEPGLIGLRAKGSTSTRTCALRSATASTS